MRILKNVEGESDLGKRLDQISAGFVGRPYVEGSLGGGPNSPEELRISLKAFDCVTYVETVLALALARAIDEFIDTIRQIRYEDGDVDWFRRNHYMVDWARNNEVSGFIKNTTSGPRAVEKTCMLSLIPGIPQKTTTFAYFPTQSLEELRDLIETGDLILFVSTRQTLDVFHAGVLVNQSGHLLLRHAARTGGGAIEQELVEFMSENKMAGFVLLRPLCRR